MDDSEGEETVYYVRKIIEQHLRKKPLPEIDGFDSPAGVFVTIHNYPSNQLRGCIGIPDAIFPLKKALVEAAISACHDPRFPNLTEHELEHIIIEVTVLTPPKRLHVNPNDYEKHIKIGRDGLIAEDGGRRGLLLPQVPIEYKWNIHEFLNQTCLKAGLPSDAWLNKAVKIFTFQGTIFKETIPNGETKRVDIAC